MKSFGRLSLAIVAPGSEIPALNQAPASLLVVPRHALPATAYYFIFHNPQNSPSLL